MGKSNKIIFSCVIFPDLKYFLGEWELHKVAPLFPNMFSFHFSGTGSPKPPSGSAPRFRLADPSPLERKLMEADRLKMRGMMWLKEHETCFLTDAERWATGEMLT